MTVQELIEELRRQDPEAAVLMQRGVGERGFLEEVDGVDPMKSGVVVLR